MKMFNTIVVNCFIFLVILSFTLKLTNFIFTSHISLGVSIILTILLKKHIYFESN